MSPSEEIVLRLRMQAYMDLVTLFEGYIEKMPQHEDYYRSIISHINPLIEEISHVLGDTNAH